MATTATLDLGLNIVATTPDDDTANNNDAVEKPTPSSNKKRKRVNKYEKRRRKSALAKQQQLQQQQQEEKQHNAVTGKQQDSPSTIISPTDKSFEDSSPTVKGKDGQNNNESGAVELVPIQNTKESELEMLRALDSTGRDDSSHATEEWSPQEQEKTEKEDSESQNKTSPTTKPKSDAEHAAYMAEYHARPLELDRRNGATATIVNLNSGNAAARRKRKREAAQQKQRNTSNSKGPSHQEDDATMNNFTDKNKTTAQVNDDKEKDGIFTSHTQWKDLPLDDQIVQLLTTKSKNGDDIMDEHHTTPTTGSLGYDRPTHIQERVIRAALLSSNSTTKRKNPSSNQSSHKNIWVQSETGSGKTMAYFLPILQNLWQHLHQQSNTTTSRSELGTQCLIVCPTQELVQQTHRATEQLVQKLRAGTLVVGSFCAQTSRAKEKARIRKGLTVLISTPGRLLDHLKSTQSLQTAVSEGKLKWLVLDEVDRLFDMGLAPQLQDAIRLLKEYTTSSIENSRNIRKGVTKSSDIPWRSILVSATVPTDVQTLVQAALSPSSNSSRSVAGSKEWVWIQGDNHHKVNGSNHGTNISPDIDSSEGTTQSGRSLPKQLVQYHMTVSAKLRLTTLIAFLADRVANNERTVVFLSTCASVDYYHALLSKFMEPILTKTKNHKDYKNVGNGDDDDKDDERNTNAFYGKGIFGSACSIHKLHGNVPHRQRHAVLETFQESRKGRKKSSTQGEARILLATDVAARGLNLQADWTVQYDPPCELADYIHRAGRVARAGQFGQSLLFLLPSEKSLLNILQLQQQQQSQSSKQSSSSGSPPIPPVGEMPALSLTSTLQRAAKVCPDLAHQGMQRSGMRSKLESSGVADISASSGSIASQKGHRLGEAFCSELQYRLEECVLQHSKPDKGEEGTSKLSADEWKKKKDKKKATKEASEMTLADMARSAFLSHMRAYPTKEKLIRHIFSARALHLGHIAKSFALRETPKTLVKNSRGVLEEPGKKKGKKRNASLAFSTYPGVDDDDLEDKKQNSAAQKRLMLMANAAKLQMGDADGF